MYPYITSLGIKVYMTGIGLALGILIFFYVLFVYVRKYHLEFRKVIYHIPSLIGLPYILGRYVYYIFDQGIFFPTSIKQFLIMLSPYGFNFHFVGIAIGLIISFIFFFRKIKVQTERAKRIDSFFYAFMISMIPLGIFLLLGDNFIGKMTDSWIGISALTTESAWTKYTRVFPLGFLFSIFSFLSLVIVTLLKHRYKIFGLGNIGFIIFMFLLNIIFLLQIYNRHLVYGMGSLSFDIKNYMTVLIMFICLISFFRNK